MDVRRKWVVPAVLSLALLLASTVTLAFAADTEQPARTSGPAASPAAPTGPVVHGGDGPKSARPVPPGAGAAPGAADKVGAAVPFVEYEAEAATTDGTVLKPDRTYTTLATEASGRQAVTLAKAGQFVEFTLTETANAVTLRYSIPDSADGAGQDSRVDVTAGGKSVGTVALTSKFSFFYGKFPFTNTPSTERPHHFYDEARTLLGSTLDAGTKVRVATTDDIAVTLDVADFELVAPAAKAPANALDVVTDFHADPTGKQDSTAKFQAAVDAGKAQGRPVFVPTGTFTLFSHVILDGVTLQGAGPWFSVLGGRDPADRTKSVGLFGRANPRAPTSRSRTWPSSATSASGPMRMPSRPSAASCRTPWWTTYGFNTSRPEFSWTARRRTSRWRTVASWTKPPTG